MAVNKQDVSSATAGRNVAVPDDRLAHLEDRLRYCVGVAPPGRARLKPQS